MSADNGGWKKIEEGYSPFSSLVCVTMVQNFSMSGKQGG